jgi:hypothetical protein
VHRSSTGHLTLKTAIYGRINIVLIDHCLMPSEQYFRYIRKCYDLATMLHSMKQVYIHSVDTTSRYNLQ